jgi:pantothenate kinase
MPGAGKSRLAEELAELLGPRAVYVPMDGFHLANEELVRLERRDRKGAPDTFDCAGYVALLRRLRAGGQEETCVYAPRFRREIEEPVAGAIPVPPEVPLVITEGLYLLVETGGWGAVRSLLDQVWYVEVAEELRIERLVARHQAFGKPSDESRRWALGSDQRNAELVRTTRGRADLVVRME